MNLQTFDQFIWILPKQKRKINIQSKRSNLYKTFDIIIPDMVFYVNKNNLHIYFAKSNKQENTILIPTPFMNVDDNDDVCIGDQDIINPESFNTISEFMFHWETMFFSSPFTHNSKSNWIFTEKFKPTTYSKIWEFFEKEKTIDLKWIIPTNFKIKDLIK